MREEKEERRKRYALGQDLTDDKMDVILGSRVLAYLYYLHIGATIGVSIG